MIRILVIFLVLIISVFAGIQLSRDPGYLFISLNRWSLETPLWFAVLSLILIFLLLHWLLIVLRKLQKSPKTFRNWRTRRRALKAKDRTRRGIIEYSEGHWSHAENHLMKGLKGTDNPLLNYLTAARAAQEMGNNQLRDAYLREAEQSIPDAKMAVELTQAQLQLDDHQWEQAFATLQHLRSIAPRHPYVLKLLMQLYQETNDWLHLISLLPELKKYQVVQGTDFDALQEQTYLAAFRDLVEKAQFEKLDKRFENLPKNLKKNPQLMSVYCQSLIDRSREKEAEAILRNCLRKEFDEQLIKIYGQLKFDGKQLAFAESFLPKHPQSAPLYLCLGRLSLNSHLWGKAKIYFEKSISLSANPEAYEELGKLLERLNDQSGACLAYRKGLTLKTER